MNSAPSVIVFDVNETLSDMSPMGVRFAEVGAPAQLAKLWFATLLRDGFALTAAGGNGAFAEIGAEALRGLLPTSDIGMDLDQAVAHVMAGMTGLSLHPDVPHGVRALRAAGYRLVTLTNGSAQVAEKLFTPAGILDQFELLLSVEDAPAWKPAATAYHYASGACGVEPGEMMLVAVHPWDVHGAARAGLGTAWINRNGANYPDYFAAPDYTVATLTELPEALGQCGRSVP
ncbi:haloacid dehalogenase type II [Pseudarthrobacter raffinosi]|uniref:haloacid dehalogenase type II n=1 Tax=Pseudarthrobacter raffinosi TaxID=2953651 RepID=UPI00208F2ADC|nr:MULTISPECIES: haloacid dehalogenase type II [unclassified Pseudarthrobacter]MCO4239193.1 haloacid dehalogenase type II [Pseudarthrobacter sp. MDT3-28]MCO4251551.1 haloacid dehalogenase type II [Pseudarthrobacter sp. MDT3-9]